MASDDNKGSDRIAWYVALEDARRRNDFARAAEAIEQLKRLGVVVKYTRGKAAAKGGGR